MNQMPLPGLDEDLLQTRLVAPGLYSALVRVETTGSTNEDLLAAAEAPDFHRRWPHLSVLTAEEQTGGRGRLARSWASPAGSSLSTSVVLTPALAPDQRHWLSLTAGFALVTVLRDRGLAAALKWPNDVQVTGRKIAGILAAVPGSAPETVILGCGINVLLRKDQLPTSASTSLLVEIERAGHPPLTENCAARLRTELLADWLACFAQLMQQIQETGDIGPLAGEIIGSISTVGQQVRVELPDGSGVRGTAVAVQTSGALTLEVSGRRRTALNPEADGGAEHLWTPVSGGVRESFTAGDVVHLRPV